MKLAQVEAEQSEHEAEGLQAQAAERAAHAAVATGLRSQVRLKPTRIAKLAAIEDGVIPYLTVLMRVMSTAAVRHRCADGAWDTRQAQHAQVSELSAMLDLSEREHAALKSQLAAEQQQRHHAAAKVERLTAGNRQLLRDKVCTCCRQSCCSRPRSWFWLAESR